MTKLPAVIAPLASGLLVWLAMPGFGFSWLLWGALVPLLLVVRRCHAAPYCLLAGYLYGLVYAALCVRWITVVPEFPLAGYLAMVAWIALFPALFALLTGLILQRTTWPLWLVAPPLWVAVEYLRVILPVAPSPLALLGHAFHDHLSLLQLASLASAYGLGFVVVLVNAALAGVVSGAAAMRRGTGGASVGRLSLAAGVALLVPVSAVLWGEARLADSEAAPGTLMTVAAVQANIPQADKWRRDQRRSILDRHRELSRQAAGNGTGLVVWPETAIPGDLRRVVYYREYLGELARELSVPLLVGSAAGDKDGTGDQHRFEVTNSAFLVDAGGGIVDAYHKHKLLPFAEQVPFGEDFPWPAWMTPAERSFTPGEGVHLLQLPAASLGVVICWENLFPQLFRRFPDAGARFMVNMTNEAWFDNSEGGYYLLASAVFRAAENGVALLRVANTGVSALIGPHGTIRQRVTDAQGNDLMVEGVLNAAVPHPLEPTFYRKYGDVFALGCVAMVGLMLLFAAIRRPAGEPASRHPQDPNRMA